MDQNSISERHKLRRKLRFWRLITVLVAIFLLGAIYFTQKEDLTAQDHIARVEIYGIIEDDNEFIRRLEIIENDDYAKALILTISSSGGTTYGGERIYNAIKRVSAKKPVVADIRTLAASAGYMVALGADHIVAGETSIVGSIGVIFQYPQISELLKKIGVSYEAIKSSPLKAEPSFFHPTSDEAAAMINAMITNTYDWFVDLVVENRNLPRVTVLKLADGSIYTGRQGLENKLVDQLGGQKEILAFLQSKNIDSNLEIIDRLAPQKPADLFSIGDIMGQLIGPDGKNTNKWLHDQKLFLDGLLSIWQSGARTP